MPSRRVPWGAVLLTVAGGFFLLLGGALLAFFGIVFWAFGHPAGFLFTGLAIALLVWLMAGLMVVAPTARVGWGIATVLLAVFSLVYNLAGGLVVGFLLTFLGGLIAIFGRRGGIRPMVVVPV